MGTPLAHILFTDPTHRTKQYIWQLCEIFGNMIQKFHARYVVGSVMLCDLFWNVFNLIHAGLKTFLFIMHVCMLPS